MKWKGSFTIEAAVIVPIFLLVCGFLLHVLFYYHDKNIVEAAVHETLSLAYGREAIDESQLEKSLYERVRKKTLLLRGVETEVVCKENDVKVCCVAQNNPWRLQIESVTKKTTPEVYIRSVRKLEKLAEKLEEEP